MIQTRLYVFIVFNITLERVVLHFNTLFTTFRLRTPPLPWYLLCNVFIMFNNVEYC